MDTQQKYGLIRSMFEGSQIEPIEALKYLKEKGPNSVHLSEPNYVDTSDIAKNFNLSPTGAERILNVAKNHGFCKKYGDRLWEITSKGSDFVDNADELLSTIE